jgi:NAD(P)-dependent dehydrogenase (short-subunit alcohol dehydrogenase family)
MNGRTPRRIVLTGANRGLGLEFTRQWIARGDRVFALERSRTPSESLARWRKEHPEQLFVESCDVTMDDDVMRAVQAIDRTFGAIDLLVNNAGTYGSRSGPMEEVDLEEMYKTFGVNALGPIRLTRRVRPLLRRGERPAVVNISSLMGSIEDNTSGGSWAYRTSKAALNMVTRNMGHDLAGDGIVCVALHPGWVRTDMGGEAAPLTPEESVGAMIATIEGLSPDQSGKMLDRDGRCLPW